MIKKRVRGWRAGAGTAQCVGGRKKQGNNNPWYKLIFIKKNTHDYYIQLTSTSQPLFIIVSTIYLETVEGDCYRNLKHLN